MLRALLTAGQRDPLAPRPLEKAITPAEWARGDDSALDSPALPRVENRYTDSAWLYAAVRRISTSVAQVPFVLRQVRKDGTEGEPVTSGPLYDLLRRPTPGLTGPQLWEALVVSLLMEGEWLLWMDTGNDLAPSRGNVPKALRPLPPAALKPRMGKGEMASDVAAWRAEGGTGTRVLGQREFPAEQVLHGRFYSPTDPHRGQSPWPAIRREIEADLAASEWNRRAFASGEPPGVLSTDQDIDREGAQAAADEWRRRYGGIWNRGRIAVLGRGLKYQVTGTTPKDMEFAELRDWARAAVLGVLGVPLLEVSVLQEVNRATAEVVSRVFWQRTLMPIMRGIEETFSAGLFAPAAPGLVGRFATETVEALQPDVALKMDAARALWGMGVPFNRIDELLELGVGPISGGDVGFLPAMVMPVDDLVGDDEEEEGPPPAPPGAEAGLGGLEAKGLRWTPERRELAARGFAAAGAPLERALSRSLRRWAFRLRRRALAALTDGRKAGPPLTTRQDEDAPTDPAAARAALFDLDEAEAELLTAARPRLREAARRALAASFAEIGLDPTLDVDDPRVADFLGRKEIKTKFIAATLHDRLRQVLQEAIRLHAPLGETVRQVRDVFGVARNRALVIARTEIAQTMNGSRWMAHEDLYERGVVESKTWVSAGDERVRESHAEAHGQSVPVPEPFDVGGVSLMHPGDIDGPPEETIQCRCVEVVE